MVFGLWCSFRGHLTKPIPLFCVSSGRVGSFVGSFAVGFPFGGSPGVPGVHGPYLPSRLPGSLSH